MGLLKWYNQLFMYNITVFNKFNMILNPYLSTVFKSIYYAVIDNPI